MVTRGSERIYIREALLIDCMTTKQGEEPENTLNLKTHQA